MVEPLDPKGLDAADEKVVAMIEREKPGMGRAIVLAGRAMFEAERGPDAYANASAADRAHHRFLADCALAAAQPAPDAGVVKRKQFPILSGGGATIDWQLVQDHGRQAQANHYQTVQRLAERGGLAWQELHAVLHNRRFEMMELNKAMIECRALEAQYLATLATPVPAAPGAGEAVPQAALLFASQRTRSLTFSALTMDEHVDLVGAVINAYQQVLAATPSPATGEQ